jgi:hypothetical protein
MTATTAAARRDRDAELYRIAVRAYLLEREAWKREIAWAAALELERRIGGRRARALERAIRRQLAPQLAARDAATQVALEVAR